MSFTDWPWRHWRAQFADKPALRLNDEVLSWQLCARVDRLAAEFHLQGVEEGNGVLLLAHSLPANPTGVARAAPVRGAYSSR